MFEEELNRLLRNWVEQHRICRDFLFDLVACLVRLWWIPVPNIRTNVRRLTVTMEAFRPDIVSSLVSIARGSAVGSAGCSVHTFLGSWFEFLTQAN